MRRDIADLAVAAKSGQSGDVSALATNITNFMLQMLLIH